MLGYFLWWVAEKSWANGVCMCMSVYVCYVYVCNGLSCVMRASGATYVPNLSQIVGFRVNDIELCCPLADKVMNVTRNSLACVMRTLKASYVTNLSQIVGVRVQRPWTLLPSSGQSYQCDAKRFGVHNEDVNGYVQNLSQIAGVRSNVNMNICGFKICRLISNTSSQRSRGI